MTYSETVPRWSDTAYLLLTALAERDDHGYALARRVDQLTGGDVRVTAGGLYGTLDKLERAALIELAGQELVDGRSRRVYCISGAGREALRHRLEQLEMRAASIHRALGPA